MQDIAAVMRQMLITPEFWEKLTDEQVVAVMALVSSLVNPEIVCEEIRKGMLER